MPFNWFKSKNEVSSDEEDDVVVDSYQAYASFQFSNALFQFLDSLDSYDETASYDVCVLQFTQPAAVLHWSIYLQSDVTEGGPVYDVWYFEDTDRWEMKEQQASKVTH